MRFDIERVKISEKIYNKEKRKEKQISSIDINYIMSHSREQLFGEVQRLYKERD